MFDKSINVFFIVAHKDSPLQVIGYGHNLRNLFFSIRDDISQIIVYRWIKQNQKQEYDVAANWDRTHHKWSLSEVSGEIGLDRISEGELQQMKEIYDHAC